jgi:hypothetical protein
VTQIFQPAAVVGFNHRTGDAGDEAERRAQSAAAGSGREDGEDAAVDDEVLAAALGVGEADRGEDERETGAHADGQRTVHLVALVESLDEEEVGGGAE